MGFLSPLTGSLNNEELYGPNKLKQDVGHFRYGP